MRFVLLALLSIALVGSASPTFAAARKHRAKAASAKHSKSKPKGPRAIDDQRATEIQTALIHAGYLSGEPTGHWDASSQAAMVKLQGDNGWQTKLVPDSRALIKLGLGPSADAAPQPASSAAAVAAQSAPSLHP